MDADAWREAKAVLAEALTCPPDERTAFLLARCPNPMLRRELEAYLAEYDEDFLESVITVSDLIAGADSPPEAVDLPPGTRIGPYVVIDRLGAGGMGQVFLASDTRLDRRVALKCLTASSSDIDVRARLLDEARASARISHPNIATVHDVVEHDDRAFIVMEYVEGESLAALLRRERLRAERLVAIGRQLASALAAAHAKGIVHRDLKPANVQVARDGSVKVLDFGIAQAVSAVAAGAGAADNVGGAGSERVLHPGTPAYMSPEQMFGRAVDHRSDIYSLGVMLFEMATGHRPYSATDPVEVVTALGRQLLRPESLESTVSPQLSEVIATTLAVSPEDRYQSAAELEASLAIVARSYERPTPQTDVIPRWRTALTVGARIVGIAVLAVLAIALLGLIETAAFNHTLGRTAPFDREPLEVSFEMALRSLVLPIAVAVAVSLVSWAARFAVHVMTLSKPIDRMLTTTRVRGRRLTRHLGLDQAGGFAQSVAAFGVVALLVVGWRYRDVIAAWTTFSISTQPLSRVLPLQPGRRDRVEAYRVIVSFLMGVFAWAAIRTTQLRRRHPVRHGLGGVALVLLLFLVTTAVDEVPYRILMQSQFERVEYSGDRCYVIGSSADDWLLYCPDQNPPRNRVVSRRDAGVRRLGVIENIFSAPDRSS